MPSNETLTVVDLFAGAGGLSTGVARACEDLGLNPETDVELHAVNHWTPAVETHKRNHPWAEHYQAKIEQLHPPEVVEPDTVDLLCGGPSCTHYSTARGGKPVKEQKRASGWEVLKWVQHLRPEHLLIENVQEFRAWGPIKDGQPTRDGSIFQQWIGTLQAFGYDVLYDDDAEDYGTVLNAADYGDAQSRERLFIMASRSGRPTVPEPTHDDADPDKPDRRPASDIIDWSDLGTSIWTRDLEHARVQPLSQTTMSRIAEGLRRHCDDRVAAFAAELETIGADDLKALRERVIPIEHADRVAQLVDEPFLVRYEGIEGDAESIILRQQSGGVPATPSVPLPTISKAGAISMASADLQTLVQPRNQAYRGDHSNPLYPADEKPLHTVTARNHDGHLVTPTLLHYSHGGRLRDIDDPMPTIATEKGGAFALSTPYLVEYYGNSDGPQPLDEPLPTVTKKDRFALIVPEYYPWGLDVRYRMLQPRELKQAQGFNPDYEIWGERKKDVTAQIGNAVPVNLGRSLARHLLADETPSLSSYGGGIQADPDADVPEYEEVLPSDD